MYSEAQQTELEIDFQQCSQFSKTTNALNSAEHQMKSSFNRFVHFALLMHCLLLLLHHKIIEIAKSICDHLETLSKF